MTYRPDRRDAIRVTTAASIATMLPGSTTAENPSAAETVPTHEDTFALSDAGKKIPVIFDTDIGSDIDDTWALLYLLKCPELNLRLVAADAGQGTYRAKLAAKYLTRCGRTDVPVAIGEGDANSAGNQRDWVGDYDLDSYAGTVMPDAVDAIIETVHASPDPVTLVCVGGVPNIAAALKKDPTICGNARFVGMHGSIRSGYGGSPPPVPEANVRADPAALRATFAADWQCSITPLDTCGVLDLRGDRYAAVRDSGAVGIKGLMDNYDAFLRRVTWLPEKPDPRKLSTTLFDIVAVAMAFSEEWLAMETLPIAVKDDGMTVIEDGAPEVRCAMRWKDLDGFKDHVVDRLTA